MPALPDVLAPFVKQVLNAADHVGLISSRVIDGLVTAVFRKGPCLRQKITFCKLTGGTCLLKLRDSQGMVFRTWLCQVSQRLGVHRLRLAAVRSLNKHLLQSHTGVREGCPPSPTLFGLHIHGMRRFLTFSKPIHAPVLSSGVHVTDLAYADIVTRMHVAVRSHLLTGCSSASNIVS